MNSSGALIRRMRLERGMTQRELAARLNISDKTVSKWERGAGLPEQSLLVALSAELGVNIEQLLSGGLEPNSSEGGNMKNAKFFVCPDCGSISFCSGQAVISCCGRRLEALTSVKDTEELRIAEVEDEWFVESDHPMTKEDYISFAAFATGDSIQVIRRWPEWPLQFRLPRRGHGKLFWYSRAGGLKYRLL